MCSGSRAKIKREKVDIYMGYDGGSLRIGDIIYEQTDIHQSSQYERKIMINKLNTFTKSELIEMFLDLIDNAS
jgi:hypothetical protein